MFRIATVLRIVVLASVLLGLWFIPGVVGARQTLEAIVGLTAADFALTFLYYAWGSRHRSRLRSLTIGILMVEVLLVTAGLRLIGPAYATYGIPIYLFLIAAAAALHSSSGAYLVATLSVLAYGALALYGEAGSRDEPRSGRLVGGEGPTVRTTAVLNAITCLSFAVVSSALSDVLRRALGRSRELEDELRALNRNLEDRVQDAVAGVRAANVSLAAKNETLESTLRHVNLFARAVSHDLRNPITAASESLRLGRSAEGASHDSLISLAMENLLRADRMLVGLRDLMRTIGSPEAREHVDLEAVAREVLDELAAVRGRAPLPVQLGGGLGTVFARREELILVYRNLIANALDHNEGADGLVVEIGQEARGGESLLYVRDNGKGIDPALHERIFEPFRRGEDSKQGLGLGLALVEAVVSHAGGRVFVESQPGRGASVFFTFPDASGPGGLGPGGIDRRAADP